MGKHKVSQAARSLRKERERMGWSMSEAARRVGVSHVSYRTWELGLVVPSETYRRALASVFGVEVEWPSSASERRAIERVEAARKALEAVL